MTETFAAGRFRVKVLWADNHLLCVVKPPNLPVQKDASGDMDLLTAAKAYIGEKYHKPGNVYMGLVHRLDRPVGGTMVLARTSKAAGRLSEAFSSHTVDKRYLTVLQGELREEITLVDWLVKDEKTGMVRVVSPGMPGAKRAELVSAPIALKNGLTLARVTLKTGRAHQIRVQHAHRGLPLWGDARYGKGKPGQQIALWAYSLAFEHPVTHESVRISAPPPEEGTWRTFRDEWEKFCP